MSAQGEDARVCRVADAAKLPSDSGGEAALCEAIGNAIAARGIASYSVDVRVLGPSMIAATLTTVDGRVLPEQKHASSDRPLSRASFDRFAQVLATQLAEAGAE